MESSLLFEDQVLRNFIPGAEALRPGLHLGEQAGGAPTRWMAKWRGGIVKMLISEGSVIAA
jgi:hypothetical protein